jgi:undecaprenyl-diphosphatase
MSYFQIIILALIQGMAELLPVSSSAHVIVAERLMDLDPSTPDKTFLLIMLHTGTMFAVIIYFWRRWKALLFPPEAPGVSSLVRYRFIMMVIVATMVTGAVGYALIKFIENVVLIKILGHQKGEVEHLFKELPLIAGALFAVGLLIIAAGLIKSKEENNPLTLFYSVVIGIVQGLCLPFRGFSRSGATISTGLFCGLSRALAEDFSFALAVALTPPAIIWEARRLLQSKESLGSSELFALLLPGLVGMGFSFLSGLVALRLLSAVLEKGKWMYFGFYCLLAAAGVLAVWYFKSPISTDVHLR